MAFSHEERRTLLATPLVGKKTIGYLEGIGIDQLETLSGQKAEFLCELIADYSGLAGWATHSMAQQAIQNAIDTALKQQQTAKEQE